MTERTHFAYTQARLQARHGARPDAGVWQQLDGIGELGSYLQAARRTGLRPWVLPLHSTTDSHAVELSLRRQFRSYVDTVTRWLPARWTAGLRWTRRLPDLPAIQHLLSGEAVPGWMPDDPELRQFTAANVSLRLQALLNSDCALFVEAWQRGQPLHDAWLDHWQGLWPRAPRLTRGLGELQQLLRRQLQLPLASAGVSSTRQHERLRHELVLVFRRHSGEPAAACAHLALIALDLERLRGDLVTRALFMASTGPAA